MYINRITSVFGQRGSGKTTWLFRNLESLKPFVLIDPLYDPKFKRLGLYDISSLRHLMDSFKNGKPERVYMSPGNVEVFDFICYTVFAYGNINLVIDEVDQYSDNWNLTEQFKKLIKYGRHKKVNITMVARRPLEMNKLLRSQTNHFIIFPLGREDIRELESHIGSEAQKIYALKTGENFSEYLEYSYGTTEGIIKQISFVNS